MTSHKDIAKIAEIAKKSKIERPKTLTTTELAANSRE